MRLPLVAVVTAPVLVALTGLVTVGLVTTGSMEPAFPRGTLLLAVPGDPQPGDVVVYRAPDGARVVHRVLERTPEGLITKGDANERTDQESGIPPVAPAKARELGTLGAIPLAVRASVLTPSLLLGIQLGLLAFGIRGLVLNHKQGRALRMRPWHLFVVAGFLLLIAAPVHHQILDARGAIAVGASIIPITARVVSAEATQTIRVAPMEQARVAAEGPTEVIRAPAVPGAAYLLQFGAVWAMLPSAALMWGAGLGLRRAGL